jgi:hypothetical protein
LRPSIVEDLYMNIDTLVFCNKLKAICTHEPAHPVNQLIDGQISQYARMHGRKRNTNERPYDPDIQAQAAYQQREQYQSMRQSNYAYAAPPLEGKPNRDSNYYQMHEIPKNMNKPNGTHQNLNYASNNLNRENNVNYNQFYSTTHQKGPVSHSMGGKYISPPMKPQMQQFQGNHDMYGDNNHSHKNRDHLNMRGSTQN